MAISSNPNRTKSFQYMRNVGKSFGYAFAETFKTNNPTVTAMFGQTKDFSGKLYSGIKDFKSNFKDFTTTGFGKDVKDITKEGFSNVLSDLKSGKWYNTERSEKLMAESMGMDFESFDDFGDFDFDFDDEKMEEINHQDELMLWML